MKARKEARCSRVTNRTICKCIMFKTQSKIDNSIYFISFLISIYLVATNIVVVQMYHITRGGNRFAEFACTFQSREQHMASVFTVSCCGVV